MDTKTCTICKKEQPLTEFYKVRKVYYQSYCKSCYSDRRKKQYRENIEKEKANTLKWREQNIERYKQYQSNWWAENLHKRKEYFEKDHQAGKIKERQRLYGQRNKHKKAARKRERDACLANRTPSWSDRDSIQKIYEQAEHMRRCGHDVHVDHIIPLKGKTVSGLHVSWNLQIISATENMRKSNKLEV